MASEWLPIAAAARELGISERQARRYAKRLSEHDRQEPDTLPHPSGVESGDSPAPKGPKRPAIVRLDALRTLRDAAKTEISSVNQEPDAQPDTGQAHAGQTPDTEQISAGHIAGQVTGPTPDTTASTSINEMLLEQRERDRKEIDFLRGLVEQRDRDAAELRAALREALRAMPRQLPEATGPTPDAQPDKPNNEAIQAGQEPDSAPVVTTEAPAHIEPATAPTATPEASGAGEKEPLSENREMVKKPFWKFWGDK